MKVESADVERGALVTVPVTRRRDLRIAALAVIIVADVLITPIALTHYAFSTAGCLAWTGGNILSLACIATVLKN